MRHVVRDVVALLRAAPVFVVAALVTLAAAGFNGLMVLLMMLEVDLPGAFGRMTHFQEPHHRVHDLTFGFLFLPVVVGVSAQLRRPTRNVTGMLMALVPAAALLLALLVSVFLGNDAAVLQLPWITVGAGVLITTSLHPAGRDFFRSFRRAQPDPTMLGLVLVAAVPLLAFAYGEVWLQGTLADDHAAAGHHGFMAAFALTVVGVGVLASLRGDGWKLCARIAGLLPPLLGLTSLAYPDATSSLGPFWSVAALAWGAMFIATAELTTRRPLDDPDPASARLR